MTPDNGSYMVAAYAITAVILVVYGWSLWRRGAAAMKDDGTPAP